jgi:hypothetical protein
MALIEAAGGIVIAEAFEASGSALLGLLQKQRAATPAAGSGIHEQHVDMSVGHE